MAKTQAESEQPAKVYQLDALGEQLKAVNEKLNTIVNQTAGLATTAQLEAAKLDHKEKLEEAVKDIHAEYRPKFQRTEWLYKIVIGETISLLGLAATVIFLTKG